ncbi:MAG: ABC transporter ATP-binding protein [Chloroflexota bacterium]
MKVILRVLSYVRPYWLAASASYVCMLLINAVSLVSPQLIRRIVDIGIHENQPTVLASSVLLLLFATILQGLFRFGQGYLSEWASQYVAYDVRNQVYEKLHSLSFSYHDRTQAGQLLSRTTSDVERLERITGRGLLNLVDTVVLLVGSTVIMVQMQPLLALLSLAVMPPVVLIMRWFMENIHPLWHERQDRMGVLTSLLEQNLKGVRVVRGFAQEPAEKERFGAENNRIFDLAMRVVRAESFVMPLIVLLASASTVLILWAGGRMVIAGTLTLGALVAFNTYLLQLIRPMRRLGFIASMLGESRASAERVFEILDARSEVQNARNARPLGEIKGAVSFEHVSFAYVGGAQVLNDVSFEVRPGQVVALLGPTGSGKSTIINLIPRFYDVTEGVIRIDGVNTRTVTVESLRRQIGIVLQETTLFGSTIRENITFGRTDATQEEMENAARAAAAHDFIMSCPKGYDTEVGERGVTLSGGQRQRIAIARALLLDPRILILDDATSSVDTDTEQQIQAALQRLMRGRTSFVIAQRVSTVRLADLILVIDGGHLVASGRHQDLIRESGIYADIYYRQLKPEATLAEPALVGRS